MKLALAGSLTQSQNSDIPLYFAVIQIRIQKINIKRKLFFFKKRIMSEFETTISELNVGKFYGADTNLSDGVY